MSSTRNSDETGWLRRMSQKSSRPAGAEESSVATPRSVLNSPKQTAPANSRDYTTPAAHQNHGTLNSSVPSKRSRDELDPETDALRTPLRDKFIRTSPEHLRQIYVPDRREAQSPHQRSFGSLSPESRRRYDRGDYWSPQDHHSSPPRKTPPRRGSMVRNTSSEHVEWPRSLPKSSPVTSSRPALERNSDSWEAQSFRNLTWKAPDLDARTAVHPAKPKPQLSSARSSSIMQDTSAGLRATDVASAKVDYNGLKGVPTGPKQPPVPAKADRSKSQSLLPVNVDVKLKPHIFISAECVPSIPKTRTHLHKYLRTYIPKEQDICVDSDGWYLCFEDSDAGRRSLAMCFKKHHQKMLFSMYPMHMQCFPSGQPEADRNTSLEAGESNVVPATDAASSAQSFLDGLGLALETTSPTSTGPGISSIHETDASAFPPITNGGAMTSPLLSQIANHHLRRSSPLSVPSRQERDETSSSISGITGSDISASKRLNCHVCQRSTTYDTDPPIQCSSCPRRYHRRCHPRPTIPADLDRDRDHHWQCRRCIRKQVPPKSRLSNTLPDAGFSPAASVGQPDEPSPKRLRIDVSPPDLVQDPIPSVDGLDAPSLHQMDGLMEDRPPGLNQELSDADDTYEPAEMTLVNNDEGNLSEANDLVAKSFANVVAVDQQPARSPLKSGKLNLTRKKILRPDEVTIPENVQSKATTTFSTPIAAQAALEKDMSIQASENGSPNHRKKPHRWSGGGADKDIIKAGRDHFFTEHVSPPHNNTGSSGILSGAAALDPETMQQVPETPDELFNPKPQNHDDVERRGASIREKIIGGNADTTRFTDPGAFGSAGAPAPSVKQRMKPRTPAISQCIKCQKKIAAGPSGTNIYCSGCKKQVSEESTARPLVSHSEKLVTRTDNYRGFDYGIGEADNRTYVVTREHFPEVDHLVDQSDRSQSADPVFSNPRVEHAQRGNSAEHRKQYDCSIASPELDQAFDKVLAATVEDERDQDGSEADLDFWKAKTPPKPEDSHKHSKATSSNEALENEDALDIELDSPLGDEEVSPESDLDGYPREDEVVSSQSKRRSQTRPAHGTYDLGDSFTRPPNTYVKLIGMALCSAPGHRMKGNDIVQWVIKHVPSYKPKQGKWENSLRATMTLKRAGYNGGEGLWKIVDDGAKKNQGFVYELLPGKAETMLHWDPALQQPISPPKGWRIESSERRSDVTPAADRSQNRLPDSPESPVKSPSRRRKREADRAEGKRLNSSHRAQMQLDTPDESISAGTEMDHSMEDVDESSSSEPIARRRHKARQESTAAKSGLQSNSTGRDKEYMMNVDPVTSTNLSGEIQQSISSFRGQTMIEHSHSMQRSRKPTLQDLIEFEAKTVDFSAKSLFDEWPEYDPKNELDREAKIAEIKARPTRKQRFGKQDSSVEIDTRAPISRYVFSDNAALPERPKRTSRTAAYPWEAEEENVIQCDTIAELFNLPSNPIAIIHDGEIAYRDGSKNYSRVIYKSGYA